MAIGDESPEAMEELMWVIRPAGTHLSESHTRPGHYSALTRDFSTNELGHATLRPVTEEPEEDAEDPEFQWQAIIAGGVVMLGAIYASHKAAPHLRTWWIDRGRPLFDRMRRRVRRTRAEDDESAGEHESQVVVGVPMIDSAEVTSAIEAYQAPMHNSEAKERLIAALVAKAFSDEQFRVLRSARIETDGESAEVAIPLDSLTPNQLADGIRKVLEANPSWPDPATLDALDHVIETGDFNTHELVSDASRARRLADRLKVAPDRRHDRPRRPRRQ